MQVEKEKMQMTDHHFPIRAFSYSSLRTDISATFHIHSEIELLFVSRGEMTFHINSEVIRVKKNQVMFITENTIHACYASSKNEETQTYLLQFDPLLIFGTNIFKDYNYLSRFIEKKDSHYYIMNAFTETNLDSFGFLMKEIVKEFKLKQTAYDITIKAYIYKIISLLYREKLIPDKELYLKDNNLELIKRLEPVFKLVETNFSENITVDMAAKEMFLNYHYFCRLFKEATGKSFNEYLNFVRVSVAENLLISTDKNIIDLINLCGFSNLGYFNKVFKKIKGISPSDFRKKFR